MSDGSLHSPDRGLKKSAAGSTHPGMVNLIITSLIGLAIVVIFGLTIITALGQIGSPPMAPRADTGSDGYNPFDRAVQIVGLVTPVLTTIVGFYFGVRAGSSGREAAESRADKAEDTAKSVTSDAAEKMLDAQRALTSLKERLVADPQASRIVDEVQAENPEAFAVQSWLRRVDNLSQR